MSDDFDSEIAATAAVVTAERRALIAATTAATTAAITAAAAEQRALIAATTTAAATTAAATSSNSPITIMRMSSEEEKQSVDEWEKEMEELRNINYGKLIKYFMRLPKPALPEITGRTFDATMVNAFQGVNNYCFMLAPEPSNKDLYAPILNPGGAKGDSGIDLRFAENITIPPMGSIGGLPAVVGLKLRARCFWSQITNFIPYQIVARSSIAKTPLGLANAIGIIDAGYTGELKLAIRNFSNEPYKIARGVSLFQLVLPNLVPATVIILPSDHWVFEDTVRGAGGFGSTGAEGSKN